MTQVDSNFFYSFPAVRGQQADRPFYIATCPLRIIPKIFIFDEEEVPAELRAQRSINKARIPEITRYLVDNPTGYVFSALTASVEKNVTFLPAAEGSDLGTLHVPMEAQILINDGQHRRAAIEEAIKERPELGQDNIAVLFFVDEGLTRSQQMFADLNKHAVRPSPSLSSLYDFRDSSAAVARHLALNIAPFVAYTEMEKSSVALKSAKLFTLSSIKQATQILLNKGSKASFTDDDLDLASEYWSLVNNHIAEWQMVQAKDISPSQLRQEFINAHGVGLQALGMVGQSLLRLHPEDWREKIEPIRNIDWRKANPVWDNRAMHHGRLSKTTTSIKLTANIIRQALSIALTSQEQQLEDEFEK
ncbi:DNA sulfur modification protein DndB [Shewanella sp. MMG014]|uniref:DNA sulfur modification protein DndB n=1 Tax=Shewanella sp. MMG014 TaxID=2822691 RepID=UPI001B37252B|nr:DNA sulfur modification protein DndB [Shewanella sp. MMG014]MBQ4890070.1 DNA sulfur modification protein DndB [Shewanella sp. MMG014]